MKPRWASLCSKSSDFSQFHGIIANGNKRCQIIQSYIHTQLYLHINTKTFYFDNMLYYCQLHYLFTSVIIQVPESELPSVFIFLYDTCEANLAVWKNLLTSVRSNQKMNTSELEKKLHLVELSNLNG